ncbi:MAG TPA: nucleotidyltransferase family protein [Polyangia bacterium]
MVLAAGASSRMGTPKELLKFHGFTCLELVLRACRTAALETPIVVTRRERLPLVEPMLAAPPCGPATVVVNERPERGQTSSLQAGLLALPKGARGFLIFPVDHPLITGADVENLLNVFTSQRCAVVVPSFSNRRGHPVVVDVSLREPLLALPEGGAARDVLRAHTDDTRFVAFDDDRVLMDMDTPAAYAECLRRFGPTV